MTKREGWRETFPHHIFSPPPTTTDVLYTPTYVCNECSSRDLPDLTPESTLEGSAQLD